MRSPVPWMGSKRRLAPEIIKRIPEHVCYVEPFAGSASILFAREPSKSEVLNDINGDLVNFFRVVKHHMLEFCNQFRFAVVSRKVFEWLQDTPPETLTDIHRAARFFYLQRMAFGGKVTGQTFGVSASGPPHLNLVRLEESISETHARLSAVVIESLPWEKCIPRYDRPGTFFFIDPPYYQTAGYGTPAWQLCDYEQMAEVLAGLKGKALLTINDHPDMRRVFKAFKFEELSVRYTVGGEKTSGTPKTELLYRSWE
ncbi:MAG: DNA adenine methylase [Thermoanaerobaculia bacterium]